MKQFLSSKKGSLLDLIVILVVFVSMVIGGLAALTIGNAFMDNAEISRQLNLTSAGNTTNQVYDGIRAEGGGMDTWIVTGFFLMHISMLVLAMLIPINIVFLVINLVFITVNILVAYTFSNMPADLFGAFNITALTGTRWIFDNIVTVELAFAALLIIVMFMASRGGGATQ